MLIRTLTTACLAIILSSQFASAQLAKRLKAEPPERLAADALQNGNAVRGAILFADSQLACTTCHVAGGRDQLGPDLTRMNKQRSNVHLVESILYPSKAVEAGYSTTTVLTTSGRSYTGRVLSDTSDRLVLRETSEGRKRISIPRADVDEVVANKTSLMPDGLADKLKNRQQFLDVIRYMVELRDAAPTADLPQSKKRVELDPHIEGLVLLDRFHCANCHQNDLLQDTLAARQAPRLEWLSGRLDPNYIAQFIANPKKAKAGTAMPHVLASLPDEERTTTATEIAHYLSSKSDLRFKSEPVDATAGERGRKLFHSIGCVACHSPRDDNGRALLAESSVGLGQLRYSVSGLTAFLEDPLAARPSGHMPNMTLSHWEATDLANYLLTLSESRTPVAFEVDQKLAAAGERHFVKHRCNSCHDVPGLAPAGTSAFPSFATMKLSEGCLSGSAGTWPKFDVNEDEVRSLRETVAHFRKDGKLTRENQIQYSLKKLRCTSCHQRNGFGGVVDERDDYFTTANPNLGPQGRIPPPLTDVGAKLNRKWMREVLVSGKRIRPYVITRMPQHGAANVGHLVDLFQAQDELPKVDLPEITGREPLKKMRTAGLNLVSNDGLNCIACHTFQLKPAMTMPAVDLTEMHERLQPDWFYYYMRNPKRFHRGTVMPSFWPNGKATRQDILEGDSHQQIAAIWEWMKEGRQARTPRGLVRKPMELLATKEAVMLRRSYPGIGKRGVGVGYPAEVNFAFDAEQMRIAMLWKGKFVDPSGVWRGQGHGRVRPLARKQIQFHPGPELDDAEEPWVADDGRPPKHQFKGYELDEQRRPKFQYQFDGVSVEDYAVDIVDEKSMIRRSITLRSQSARSGLVFRLAPKDTVEKQADNQFLVGDGLVFRVLSQQSAKLVQADAGAQIQIPVQVKASEPFKIELEYELR
jgi:putative heme-binding domain-containing protein